MKKWQKVTVTVLCTAVVLGIGITAGYKTFLKPKVDEKVEQAVTKVENTIKDETVQDMVDGIAKEMIEDGVVSLDTIPVYKKYMEEREEEKKAKEQAENTASENSEQSSGKPNSAENKTQVDNAQKDKSQSGDKGVSSASSDKKNNTSSQSTKNEQGGQTPQGGGNTQGEISQNVSDKSQNPAASSQNPPNNQNMTTEQKLKAAMTADEIAFAMSMYKRVDIGYAQSLLKTDRAAAKEYVYSKVSPSEISRALEIYAKYSYLLK